MMSMSKRLQIIVADEEAERYAKAARRRRLSLSQWVRRAMEKELRSEAGPSAAQKLAALDRALQRNHPTADVDRMLAEIEAGRGLR